MPYIYDYSFCGSHIKPHMKKEKKSKDYGKCGLFRHHKIIQNKNNQYCCKYCGKMLFTLEKELKEEERKAEAREKAQMRKAMCRILYGR